MVTCSNCNTVNEPGNRFCINCGETLIAADTEGAQANVIHVSPAESPSRQLGIATVRLVVGALLIWLLRGIFLDLSFVEGLFIPNFPVGVDVIATAVASILIILLLIGYANKLRRLWPRAFPQAASVGTALATIIYIMVLSMLYTGLRPILTSLVDDFNDILLVVRFAFASVAFILLFWAARVIYDSVPGWMSGLRFESQEVSQKSFACPNCGFVNNEGTSFCANCGHELSQAQIAEI